MQCCRESEGAAESEGVKECSSEEEMSVKVCEAASEVVCVCVGVSERLSE